MNQNSKPSRLWLILIAVVVGVGAVGVWWLARRPHEVPHVAAPPGAAPAAPAPAPARPPEPAPREAAVWAVVIGIDAYRDARIPPCHGASGDARAVARWLSETAGWGRSHVLLLDDAGVADLAGYERSADASLLPTQENLDRAASAWLASKPIRPGDVVVLYFAGQAALAAGDAKTGPASAGTLLPIDARASAAAESGWRPETLIAAASAAGAGPEKPVRVVCWLDTSLNGRRDPWTPDGRPVPAGAGAAWLAGLARWPGVTAWLAADGAPSAEAARSNQRSPFTAALVEGLGTPARPGNLLSGLDRMRKDPKLTAQGFRTVGGVAPDFALWPSWVRRVVDAPPALLLQRGHAGAVQALALSPDGARVITAGADSTVRLWRLADRKLTGVLPSHLIGVTTLALRGDARLLASGDGNGRVRVWDLSRNVEVATLPAHQAGLEALGFLPSGDRLVSFDLDGKAFVWPVRENELGFFEVGRPEPAAEGASGLAVAGAEGPVGFVVAGPGAPLRVFDGSAKSAATLEGPGGIVTSARLATDGRRIVAGSDAGRAAVFEVGDPGDGRRLLPEADGPIDRVALGAGDRIAFATAKTLKVGPFAAQPAGPGVASVALQDPLVRLLFAPDGGTLAAVTRGGTPRAWKLEVPAAPSEVALAVPKDSPGFESAAFLPDGRALVVGDRSGGYSAWELPGGGPLFSSVRGRRGRVAGLSVSADRRYLLEVTREGDALVWDLARGRSLARVDGQWVAGALTPDGSRVVLSATDGTLHLADRETARVRPMPFARPEGAGEGTRFGPLAVDAAGKRVAAGSVQHGPLGPVVCVWEVDTGKLLGTIKAHAEPHAISSVEFSPDGRRLLTASEDGTAKVWDLDPAKAEPPATPASSFRVAEREDDPPVAVLAARFDPSDPRLVVTGSVDGRVLVWAVGSPRPIATAGKLDRAVAAVAVLPGGRWLAAGGGDKEIRLWGLAREADPQRPDAAPKLTTSPLRLQGAPHHDEQVNALCAWPAPAPGEGPEPPVLASGSDDTTVRLWRLSDRTPLGTLSADLDATTGASVAPRAAWVVYTPDGLFDSAVDGERQVTWLRRGELLPLEQYYDTARLFGLSDRLRRGDRPPAPTYPSEPPPRVAIDRPEEGVASKAETALTIHIGPPGVEQVRLYQNGVPVTDGRELTPAPGESRARVTVKLARGVNRFYAMASRAGAIDGRSNEVEVVYDRPEPVVRRTHVLALGVGRYSPDTRALRFAREDAQSVTDFLRRNTSMPDVRTGAFVTLTDDDVNEQKVVDSFMTIRDSDLAPDDTVVVFVAGHTGTQRERYYLLLPEYPFPKGEDEHGDLREVRSKTALAFSALQENLSRLRCLNRLVVVDACQAEALLDDPTVQRLGRAVDDTAHRARTAYILAARRGESASEAPILKHGLLTYTLLKGLGETGLEALPDQTVLRDPPSADRNGDALVTASELALYTGEALPRLASSLPDLVMRGAAGLPAKADPARQHPRVQATDLNFPLLRLK